MMVNSLKLPTWIAIRHAYNFFPSFCYGTLASDLYVPEGQIFRPLFSKNLHITTFWQAKNKKIHVIHNNVQYIEPSICWYRKKYRYHPVLIGCKNNAPNIKQVVVSNFKKEQLVLGTVQVQPERPCDNMLQGD